MACNGIVLEVLSKENYENWSVLVRNYLIGEGLWDMVTDSNTEDELWEKKNARALHAIQLSCGSDNLTHIRNYQKAKDAWNHLQTLFSTNSKAQPDVEQGNRTTHSYLNLGSI